MTPAPPSPGQSKLLTILNDVEIAFSVLAGVGGAVPGVGLPIAGISALIAKIDSIIITGLQARQAVAGQPLDLTKLHDIELIP